MTDQNPNEPTGEMVLDTDPMVEIPAPDAETPLVHLDASLTGVATVTINRPAKKNAFNQEVIGALREAFETLHGADHVRICFICGAGGTFSAGADLEWMRDSTDWTEADNREDAYDLARMLKALADIPALTVALVEGAAFGGGAGLAAACDMAVAVKGTKFAFSEVKLGLIPATISPYVVDAIGPRYAKALFCTGRVFDAEFAQQTGLVQHVVADAAALDAFAKALAADIMLAAPDAVRLSKKLVWDVWGVPIDDHLMRDTAHRIAKQRVSPEGQEGVRAFLDKRKPSWTE
jgi:methylglutaconyl-CoA hydratase